MVKKSWGFRRPGRRSGQHRNRQGAFSFFFSQCTIELFTKTTAGASDVPFQIDVPVNAPTAGKIVELLAKEEDTVTVGQELFRIEPEGGPSFISSKTLHSLYH
jgi:hypothetical protein